MDKFSFKFYFNHMQDKSLMEILLLCNKHTLVKIPKIILIEIFSFLHSQYIIDFAILKYNHHKLRTNTNKHLSSLDDVLPLDDYCSHIFKLLDAQLIERKKTLDKVAYNNKQLQVILKKYHWLFTYKNDNNNIDIASYMESNSDNFKRKLRKYIKNRNKLIDQVDECKLIDQVDELNLINKKRKFSK